MVIANNIFPATPVFYPRDGYGNPNQEVSFRLNIEQENIKKGRVFTDYIHSNQSYWK